MNPILDCTPRLHGLRNDMSRNHPAGPGAREIALSTGAAAWLVTPPAAAGRVKSGWRP